MYFKLNSTKPFWTKTLFKLKKLLKKAATPKEDINS